MLGFRVDEEFKVRPGDSVFFVEEFWQRSIGIILRRHGHMNYAYVKEIIMGTQADGKNIVAGDRLWALDDFIIGTASIGKEEWDNILKYIKYGPRPLKLTFRRLLVEEDEPAHLELTGRVMNRYIDL